MVAAAAMAVVVAMEAAMPNKAGEDQEVVVMVTTVSTWGVNILSFCYVFFGFGNLSESVGQVKKWSISTVIYSKGKGFLF